MNAKEDSQTALEPIKFYSFWTTQAIIIIILFVLHWEPKAHKQMNTSLFGYLIFRQTNKYTYVLALQLRNSWTAALRRTTKVQTRRCGTGRNGNDRLYRDKSARYCQTGNLSKLHIRRSYRNIIGRNGWSRTVGHCIEEQLNNLFVDPSKPREWASCKKNPKAYKHYLP